VSRANWLAEVLLVGGTKPFNCKGREEDPQSA
jgi:hypothetical protein